MVYPCLLSNKRDFLRRCSPPIIIHVQKFQKKRLNHRITSGGKPSERLIPQSQVMVLFPVATGSDLSHDVSSLVRIQRPFFVVVFFFSFGLIVIFFFFNADNPLMWNSGSA